jgi:hypothetical protein
MQRVALADASRPMAAALAEKKPYEHSARTEFSDSELINVSWTLLIEGHTRMDRTLTKSPAYEYKCKS